MTRTYDILRRDERGEFTVPATIVVKGDALRRGFVWIEDEEVFVTGPSKEDQ
jgi:hypothetical protein